MQRNFLNPFTAILTGAVLGLAIAAPFGGLASFRAAQSGQIMTCDIMGCKVQTLRP